jgi:hypothetical protein
VTAGSASASASSSGVADSIPGRCRCDALACDSSCFPDSSTDQSTSRNPIDCVFQPEPAELRSPLNLAPCGLEEDCTKAISISLPLGKLVVLLDVFRPPDTVLAAKILNLDPGIGFAENRDDLCLSES